MMSKKLSETQKFDSLRDAHYNKYMAIKTKVIKSYEDQKDLLDKMNNFNGKTDLKREFELEKKKKAFINLDKQVNNIKLEEIETDKEVEKMKNIGEAIKYKYKDIDFKNDRINLDLQNIKKDYMTTLVFMLKIKETMNVETIDDVIVTLVDTRTNYCNNKNEFNLLNNGVETLNKEYSYYKNSLEELQYKLVIKRENLAKEEENILESEDVQQMLLENKEDKITLNNLQRIVDNKIDLITSIIRVFTKYYEPINEIINRLQIQKISSNSKLNVSNSNSYYSSSRKSKITIKIDQDYSLLNNLPWDIKSSIIHFIHN